MSKLFIFVYTVSKMNARVLIFLAITTAVYEANCNVFVHEGLTGRKVHKRQTQEQFQCIAERMDDYFRGNTWSFVATCKSAALLRIRLDLSSGAALQRQLEPFFNAYCVAECGTAINDAFNHCGVYASTFPGTEKLNVDLCGTNVDGIQCYLLYGKGFDLSRTEASCSQTLRSSRVCTCRLDLREGVEEQGCCIDAYYDFISGLPSASYSPRALYRGCNVDFPTEGCNNSPVLLSSAPTKSLVTVLVTTVAAVIFSLSVSQY